LVTLLYVAQNGVRGLMLDMYDFRNDVWLFHSYGGICQNFTAFVSSFSFRRPASPCSSPQLCLTSSSPGSNRR